MAVANTVGVESYCEAIYELHEDDAEVIQARLAGRLGFSRASVSEMVRRLRSEGLLAVEGDTIRLTPEGNAVGERVVRRHRLAERFLTDILGLSWAQAHHEAGRWEHVLTDDVEEAMSRLLGGPTTCPHGNPIPGSSYSPPAAVPLAELAIGEAFTVTRITEELEFIDGMLEFLEGAGVRPEREGLVTAVSPDGTRTLRMSEGSIGMGAFPAERILVVPTGPRRQGK